MTEDSYKEGVCLCVREIEREIQSVRKMEENETSLIFNLDAGKRTLINQKKLTRAGS